MSPSDLSLTTGRSRLTEYGLLVLLAVLWGSSYGVMKVAVETIPPLTATAARTALAAVLLIAVARAYGHSLADAWKRRRTLMGQAMLNSILPFTLISWGLLHIDSGLAGILNATPPIFVLLITYLWTRHETVTGRSLAGVIAGMSGVVLMIGVDALAGAGNSTLAQLAVTAASLCYGGAVIYGRRFNDLPPVVTAAGTMTLATVVLVPASLAVDRPWTVSPSTASLAALLCLSAFCTALALTVYFRLIRTLGSMGLSSNSYLRVAVSVAVGVLFLGETVTWTTALGLVLVLAGVASVNRAGGRNTQSAAAK